MERLSGDQNGQAALSVPDKGCVASESNERIQRRAFPDESLTLIAKRRPSGEIKELVKDACSVGEMKKRMVCASSGARRKYGNARPIAAMSSTAVAAIHMKR